MPLGGSGNGQKDSDTRTQEGDRGLIQNVRPASAEVTGQQRELFAFDAFEYETPEILIGDTIAEDYFVSLKAPWKFKLGDVTISLDNLKPILIGEDDKIRLDRIDVNEIFAQDITATGTITGASIDAGTITGTTITGTTITGGTVTGTTISGGSITIGSDFSVSSSGAVTASDILITGGSITGGSIVGDLSVTIGNDTQSVELTNGKLTYKTGGFTIGSTVLGELNFVGGSLPSFSFSKAITAPSLLVTGNTSTVGRISSGTSASGAYRSEVTRIALNTDNYEEWFVVATLTTSRMGIIIGKSDGGDPLAAWLFYNKKSTDGNATSYVTRLGGTGFGDDDVIINASGNVSVRRCTVGATAGTGQYANYVFIAIGA